MFFHWFIFLVQMIDEREKKKTSLQAVIRCRKRWNLLCVRTLRGSVDLESLLLLKNWWVGGKYLIARHPTLSGATTTRGADERVDRLEDRPATRHRERSEVTTAPHSQPGDRDVMKTSSCHQVCWLYVHQLSGHVQTASQPLVFSPTRLKLDFF